jgi:hypothetical protein
MESLQNNTPPGPPISTKVQGGCLIPKGTIQKTVILRAVLSMTTPFAVFLLAGIQKSLARGS